MRVAVVGAGLSGLMAARNLATDHDVVVIERSRSVGGRLATRRVGDAVLDHGAQFFTVRRDEFRDDVDDWVARGVARVWCHGFAGRHDGYPRYIGTNGMNSIAKHLAADGGFEVRTDTLAFSITTGPSPRVTLDDGSVVAADAVVVAVPAPQAWALLAADATDLPESLVRTEYRRTIALLAVLDRPGAVPEPGGVQFDPGDASSGFTFIGDNHAKGVSPVPAVTFHATNEWSAEHWDADTTSLAERLAVMARPWLGAATIVDAQVKKWRFAGPAEPWPEPCWVDVDRRIVLAGDIFAGPKVEGAYHSGRAASTAVNALA